LRKGSVSLVPEYWSTERSAQSRTEIGSPAGPWLCVCSPWAAMTRHRSLPSLSSSPPVCPSLRLLSLGPPSPKPLLLLAALSAGLQLSSRVSLVPTEPLLSLVVDGQTSQRYNAMRNLNYASTTRILKILVSTLSEKRDKTISPRNRANRSQRQRHELKGRGTGVLPRLRGSTRRKRSRK
jgi:hypothetical protein